MNVCAQVDVFVFCFLIYVNGRVIKHDNKLYRLDIIHYNDFHDRFEETSVSYPICRTNDTNCLGGFARLYQEIKTLMKEATNPILLNAGDTFQGTYWYTLLKWNVTQNFINMLPHDAHAIGNHEFDDGPAGLRPYLAALKAPVVAANIDTINQPEFEGLYKPHVIIERKGRQIGIIGLITTDTAISSNVGNVSFMNPIEVTKREAQILNDAGVDIIIVLSHCGLEIDKKIAETVGENVDIIVGGHSHSLLWNGESPSKEYVSGPYPVLIKSKVNPEHKVLIVTAASYSKYLGNITTYFDKTGELKSFEASPIFLNRSIPEDPNIKALLQPYMDKLHVLVNEPVGYTKGDLLGDKCGSQECEIGDLTADAFLFATKQQNVSSLPHVSFLLRNMIRGAISKGDITRGNVINTLPYGNKVTTFVIKGKYIKEALERCLTIFWVASPFNGPWMSQTAGMKITLNTTLGEAVTVLVKEGDQYVPLDEDRDYQMITVTFLSRGGNTFEMLRNNLRDERIIGTDADILENYIKLISPITPTLDNRLTVLS